MSTIIESVRNYIKTCPYLKEFEDEIVKVNVDKLEEESTVYSINESVFDPILKRYIDGSSERQFVFVFASRESYGKDVIENINNIGFYEDFADWLDNNSKQGILPSLGEGKQALSIQAITNGYAFQTDIEKAQYQIQIQLKYFQERR